MSIINGAAFVKS